MNTKHFPDLSLCKKLTEIGFPFTEKIWDDFHTMGCGIIIKSAIERCGKAYVCPSVMEMLDFIYVPLHHRISIDKMFDIDDGEWYKVSFYSSEYFNNSIIGFQGNLPDALAEMCLWLHENNYISFSN